MYTTLISIEALHANLTHPDWVVVDCRFSLADTEKGRRAYREGHIPGAFYAHLDEDLSGEIIPGLTGRHPLPTIAHLEKLFSQWGIDAYVQVVVYDDMNGAIAARLWWMLHWLGHEKAAVLDGGWPRWQAAGYPESKDDARRPARRFEPAPKMEWLVNAETVAKIRLNPEYKVVDSRAADRYAGENETIDPVAGHIPGAINLPFGDHFLPEGGMRKPEALRNRFTSDLAETPPENTVFYCGSGVTACHNLLAYRHAGLGHAKLYAGSWSDWITDEDRPVATSDSEAV